MEWRIVHVGVGERAAAAVLRRREEQRCVRQIGLPQQQRGLNRLDNVFPKRLSSLFVWTRSDSLWWPHHQRLLVLGLKRKRDPDLQPSRASRQQQAARGAADAPT